MAFDDRHLTPTAMTAANPVVVTVADHGLSNGQRVRASKFYTYPLASATGMEQVNDQDFVVQSVTTNTFELWDVEGQPVDGSAFTAFTANDLGQFTLTGPTLPYENEIS